MQSDYRFVKEKNFKNRNKKDFKPEHYKNTYNANKTQLSQNRTKSEQSDIFHMAIDKYNDEKLHRNNDVTKNYIYYNIEKPEKNHKTTHEPKRNLVHDQQLVGLDKEQKPRKKLEDFIVCKEDADVPRKPNINMKYHEDNVAENFYNSQNRTNQPYKRTLRNINNKPDHKDLLDTVPDKFKVPEPKEIIQGKIERLDIERQRLFGKPE